MSTTAITIDRPITVQGVAVAVVQMRRPVVRDLLAISSSKESDAQKELTLISNLCSLLAADLMDMDAADYKKLQNQVVGFLG